MYKKNQLEGFLTLIVLLTVLALAIAFINNFSQEKDISFDSGGTHSPDGSGGTGNTDSPGDNGESGGEGTGGDVPPPEPEEPEEPQEPECEHVDSDDNNFCDNCGVQFSDGAENPSNPEPEEPECNHRDINDNGMCDKCYDDFSDGTERGTADLPANGVFVGDFAVEDSNEIIQYYEVIKTEVDLEVLYWNDEYYADTFKLEMDTLYHIIPVTVEGYQYLHKIRITFLNYSDFSLYASSIEASGVHQIISNESGLYIDLLYSDESYYREVTSSEITLSNGGGIRKELIKSIDVFVFDKK